MEIHMIGHASIYLKTEDCRILMDPIFCDPFYEDRNESCPKREVFLDKVPEFDFLIISHSHLDHFDIRTLSLLPKFTDVLIPPDKSIESYLKKLGYSQIYILKDFEEVRVGNTSIVATRSENRVPEFGILVNDKTGLFWNQVDSDVSTITIKKVVSKYGYVDLLLAAWQPMLEACYQFNKEISFPYRIYSQLLYKISLIQPRAIAPGANGFKFVDSSDWLNQVTFPVTRERFCQDIQDLMPEISNNIFTLDPGDILSFSENIYSYKPNACDYVKMTFDNRYSIKFEPVTAGNPLVDLNCLDTPTNAINIAIMNEIENDLPEFIKNHSVDLYMEHFKWRIIYQLEICLINMEPIRYYIDFSEKSIISCKGYNPMANFFSYMSASTLYGCLKGVLGNEYLFDSGTYRTFNKVYLVDSVSINYPSLISVNLEDPLFIRLSTILDTKNSTSVLDSQLQKWRKKNKKNFYIKEKKINVKVRWCIH